MTSKSVSHIVYDLSLFFLCADDGGHTQNPYISAMFFVVMTNHLFIRYDSEIKRRKQLANILSSLRCVVPFLFTHLQASLICIFYLLLKHYRTDIKHLRYWTVCLILLYAKQCLFPIFSFIESDHVWLTPEMSRTSAHTLHRNSTGAVLLVWINHNLV